MYTYQAHLERPIGGSVLYGYLLQGEETGNWWLLTSCAKMFFYNSFDRLYEPKSNKMIRVYYASTRRLLGMKSIVDRFGDMASNFFFLVLTPKISAILHNTFPKIDCWTKTAVRLLG